MLQRLINRYPLVLLANKFANQILSQITNVFPVVSIHMRVTLDSLANYLFGEIAIERKSSRKHVVNYHSQAETINLSIIILTQVDLGGSVVWGANVSLFLGDCVKNIFVGGQSHINNLDFLYFCPVILAFLHLKLVLFLP
jgi:hypothetical protein